MGAYDKIIKRLDERLEVLESDVEDTLMKAEYGIKLTKETLEA